MKSTYRIILFCLLFVARPTFGWVAALSVPYSSPIITSDTLGLLSFQESMAPQLSLKNGTLLLLDPLAPSFNIGAEQFFTPRASAYLEGGPLFNIKLLFQEPTVEQLSGYRLRGALRYYLKPIEIGGDFSTFIELMYTHQYTDADIEGDFRRQTSSGRFNQRITYTMEQRKQGGFINLGLQQIFQSRFIFEFGAGIGVRFRRESFSGVPDDAWFLTNGSISWEYNTVGESLNTAAALFYLNLGYVLR